MTDHPRRLVVLVLAAAATLVAATATVGHAKEPAAGGIEGPVKFMLQALGRVAGEARQLEDGRRFGFEEGICLLGSYIQQGNTTALDHQLEGGRTYVFLGGGDDDVRDADLFIFDAAGRRVAQDTDNDPTPVVTFTPKFDGRYSILLRLHDCRTPAGFCALAILREGGWDIPTESVVQASSQCMISCLRFGGRFKFHDRVNQWSLFGSVLKQGETAAMNRLDLGSGIRTFVAGADKGAGDIDLSLSDGGGAVAKDEDPDPTPAFRAKTFQEQAYSLRLNMEKTSNNASFAVMAMLDDA